MKKYAVFHDYGSEGWHVQSEHDDIHSAVMAREDDIRNGGGTSIVVEVLQVLEAYRMAAYIGPPKVREVEPEQTESK